MLTVEVVYKWLINGRVHVRRFIDLVQREWLNGGHPFSLRHGHTITAPEKERGPVFLIFLDCVWQVGVAHGIAMVSRYVQSNLQTKGT